jgi:hypothetical protein
MNEKPGFGRGAPATTRRAAVPSAAKPSATEENFGKPPPGHRAAVVNHGRFVNIPVRKDDVRRDIFIRPEAVSQAFAEYAKRHGVKPDPKMREWAYAGQIAAWRPMDGSRLRESTQRDIERRLVQGKPLTRRQTFFYEEVQLWQQKAIQLACRVLALNSAELTERDNITLEWVPIR